MPHSAPGVLQRLLAAQRRGERLVLVFDYDGTLTPLVAHPTLARLDPRCARCWLAWLQPRASPSAWSAVEVWMMWRAWWACRNYVTAAQPAWNCNWGGERQIPAEALGNRALLQGLVAAFGRRSSAYPGMWVEEKPFGFTVHYRQLAVEQIAPLRAEVMALLEPHAALLHILDGPMAIEVAPAIGRDKGTALRAIVGFSGIEPTLVLFAGDAANDAPGLAAAADLGGIALGIGPAAPGRSLRTPARSRSAGCLIGEFSECPGCW